MDAFLLNGMYIEDILILEEMSDDGLNFCAQTTGNELLVELQCL